VKIIACEVALLSSLFVLKTIILVLKTTILVQFLRFFPENAISCNVQTGCAGEKGAGDPWPAAGNRIFVSRRGCRSCLAGSNVLQEYLPARRDFSQRQGGHGMTALPELLIPHLLGKTP